MSITNLEIFAEPERSTVGLMEDETIKVGIELSESLHREVKAKAVESGLKLKEVWPVALRSWLDQEAVHAAANPEFRDLDRAQRDLLRRYAELLRNGDDEAALKVFSVLLDRYARDRARAAPRKHEKAG